MVLFDAEMIRQKDIWQHTKLCILQITWIYVSIYYLSYLIEFSSPFILMEVFVITKKDSKVYAKTVFLIALKYLLTVAELKTLMLFSINSFWKIDYQLLSFHRDSNVNLGYKFIYLNISINDNFVFNWYFETIEDELCVASIFVCCF